MVRYIDHYGSAGHYARMCMEASCVGFSVQGYRDQGQRETDGGGPNPQALLGYFGNPPICFAIPGRGKALSERQKAENRAVSRRRVRIEHIICAVKRCCILKDDIRLRADHIRDTVMEICCALHNLRLSHVPWKSVS